MPDKKKPTKSDKEFGTYKESGPYGAVTVYRKNGPYDSGEDKGTSLEGLSAAAKAKVIGMHNDTKDFTASVMRDIVKDDRKKIAADAKKGESDSKPEKSKDAKFLKMITKNKKGS